METYRVGTSPHIRKEERTSSMMLDVVIALTPALVWGIYVYGWRALTITLLSIASCLLLESAAQKIMRRPITIRDGSALVTAILLAMNLPVSVPLWVVPVGAAFAIVLVKELFGGLGKNFVNPVLAARAFLFVSFPSYLTRFTEPFQALDPFAINLKEETVDAITSATPLKEMKDAVMPTGLTLFDLFSGSYAGCIGEVSALLLLGGGIYLLARRTITWHIPTSALAAVAILSFFLAPEGVVAWQYMLAQLFSGGLILGVVFMATDYVTSPVTWQGKLVYGVVIGALTVFIRRLGSYSEGVSFAILLMNLSVWYLDRFFRPRVYGTRRGKEKKAS